MTIGGVLLVWVVVAGWWLFRRRPLVGRDRAEYMSREWLNANGYDGSKGH